MNSARRTCNTRRSPTRGQENNFLPAFSDEGLGYMCAYMYIYIYTHIRMCVLHTDTSGSEAPMRGALLSEEDSTMIKTGWIVPVFASRLVVAPRPGAYPEIGAGFRETVCWLPLAHPRDPGNSPFISLPLLCLHRTPRRRRSFTRADYTGRLQRCRRLSWTAAATRTRTRPGTKRQRPTGGTRTRPRDTTRPDNSIDNSVIVDVQVSSRSLDNRQWDVWSVLLL